uniref:Solute carrier family 22 member 21 n=1 Tax=Myripristis murdjan TaxID=586833 RepID=A0A668B064_9TELE
MTDYEAVTAFLGHWGPFQQAVFFLLSLSIIPNAFTGLSIVFIADTPSHRCLLPADANLSAAWRNSSIPVVRDSSSGDLVPSKCSRYKLDVLQNFSERGLVPWIDVNLSGVQQEGCLDGWEHDHSTYISTIVSEWDLVCDDRWKKPLTSSLFFCGVLTGSFISGQFSDRYGRKIVLFATMAIQSVFTLIQVFSPSWPVFCALFFIIGVGHISNYVAAFVLGTEILNPPVRAVFSTVGVTLFFSLGYMMLPLIAFLIRDWRTLLLTLTLPGFLCMLFWWFIPESPRWLLSQGRVKEAELILRNAAKKNKVEAPQVIFNLQSEKRKSQCVAAPACCLLLNNCLLRNTIAIAYFALSLNTSNLHGSAYFNCFLSAAIEVPAYILSWLMYRCCPRRLILFSTLFLGGVMLLFIQLIPNNLIPLAITLEMMGKFAVTVAFSVVYAYTAELYPTVLRNTALGACSMASRIGSISAPYFIYLSKFNHSILYSIQIPSVSVFSFIIYSYSLSCLKLQYVFFYEPKSEK